MLYYVDCITSVLCQLYYVVFCSGGLCQSWYWQATLLSHHVCLGTSTQGTGICISLRQSKSLTNVRQQESKLGKQVHEKKHGHDRNIAEKLGCPLCTNTLDSYQPKNAFVICVCLPLTTVTPGDDLCNVE